MQQLSTELIQKLRAYWLEQRDPGWCERHGIETLSLKELFEVPEIREGSTGFFKDYFKDMDSRADRDKADRAAYIKQVSTLDHLFWGEVFLNIDPPDPKTFADFNNDLLGVGWAYAAALVWSNGSGPGMLLLGGIPGTGKTHLAKAAYASLAAKGRDVFYRTEPGMINNLQAAIQQKNVEAVVEEISTVPWLIIDDYGRAATGDWGKAQIDSIIDARWETADAVRTLFTTNLDGEQLEQLSPRIASRMSDRTRALRVAMGKDAKDYRVTVGSDPSRG